MKEAWSKGNIISCHFLFDVLQERQGDEKLLGRGNRSF